MAWEGAPGARWHTGIVEDVSASGVCLSLDVPVPPGCTVQIRSGGGIRKALVRYCEAGQYSYLIGLEFDGMGAGMRAWRPRHLLDPQRLGR
jgi:hypothetical protein